MKSIPIRGIIPALVTPFHDDESLNLEQLKRHTGRAIDAGAHGVFCLGTNCEFFQMTADELVAVLEAVKETQADASRSTPVRVPSALAKPSRSRGASSVPAPTCCP